MRGLTFWTTDKLLPPPKGVDREAETNYDPSGLISKTWNLVIHLYFLGYQYAYKYFIESVKLQEKTMVVRGDIGDQNSAVPIGGDTPSPERTGNSPGLRYRRKLYMTRKTKILLNVNAIVLVSVFVFLYAFFA